MDGASALSNHHHSAGHTTGGSVVGVSGGHNGDGDQGNDDDREGVQSSGGSPNNGALNHLNTNGDTKDGGASDLMKGDGSDGTDYTNLIVNYIPITVTEDQLRTLFAPFGAIEKIKIVNDKFTGYSLGYGFVKFSTPHSAQAALALNGQPLHTKRLKVSISKPPNHDKRCNLYISGLPQSWSQSELEALVSVYGKVTEVRVLYDTATRKGKGVGFARFTDEASAAACINALSGSTVENGVMPLIVKYADTTSDKVRKAMQQGGYQNVYNAMMQQSMALNKLGVNVNMLPPQPPVGPVGNVNPVSVGYGQPHPYAPPPQHYLPQHPQHIAPPTQQHSQHPHSQHQQSQPPQPPIYHSQQAQQQNQQSPHHQQQQHSHQQHHSQQQQQQSQQQQSHHHHSLHQQQPQGGHSGHSHLQPVPVTNIAQPNGPVEFTGVCLFVYHLPLEATESTLFQLFGNYGVVSSAKVMRDLLTGRSKGFGFVNVLNESMAQAAIQNLNGFQLGNKYLKVALKK